MQFYVEIVVWNAILQGCDDDDYYSYYLSVSVCCCCPCLCSKEQGYDHLPFIMSLGKEVSGRDIWSALTNYLIFRGNLFHVHGSYGTVVFINRYMYFCVVAFLNDTITQSFSCLPLNFSFLQIYIKTVLHACFFFASWLLVFSRRRFFSKCCSVHNSWLHEMLEFNFSLGTYIIWFKSN